MSWLVCAVYAPLIFCLRWRLEVKQDYGFVAGGLSALCFLTISPGHEGIDVAGEMTVRQLREQIIQVGVGLDAIHFTSADQAGETGLIFPTLIMAGKERIAPVHGRCQATRQTAPLTTGRTDPFR